MSECRKLHASVSHAAYHQRHSKQHTMPVQGFQYIRVARQQGCPILLSHVPEDLWTGLT